MTFLRTWIAITAVVVAAAAPRAAEAQSPAPQPSKPLPKPTRAQEKASRAHFQAAEAANAAGDFSRAASEYLAAFDAYPHPEFVYNAGEAYRRAGDREKAVEHFKRYLALDPNGRGAKLAGAAVQEIEAAFAAEKAAADKRAEEEAAARAAAEAARAEPPPPVEAPPTEPTEPPGRTMRIAGIVTGAVGVASLGASVYFGLRASSLEEEASNALQFDPGIDERGRAANRNMIITASIGAAALGTGAVLYFLGRRAGAEEQRITVAPALDPSSVGVVAALRF
jgi:tetratricopeptide (TPR) repeat protein